MYAMEHSGLRQSRSAFRTYAVGVVLVLLATVLRAVTSVTSNLISAKVSAEALCVDWLQCFELWWGSALVADCLPSSPAQCSPHILFGAVLVPSVAFLCSMYTLL
jgi:hypothetical protein